MFKKTLVIAAASITTLAYAEPQRALFTHENKFPELHQLEVGALVNYAEYSARDERNTGPYARFGLVQNLTVSAGLPFRKVQPEFGESESGIGDAVFGLELRAWEDVFEYPYVIPHVEYIAPTSDSDKGLGNEDSVTTFGVSVGTVTYEELHWVADLSYSVNGSQENSKADNIFIGALSVIWDISEQFAVLVEGKIDDRDTPGNDVPAFGQAGFAYKWTPDFVTSFYAGAGSGGPDNADAIVTAKASYTF